MSKYEWEAGTFKIPSAAWKDLRDGLASGYNELQAKRLTAALAVHKALKEGKALAKRGTYDYKRELEILVNNSASSLARTLEQLELNHDDTLAKSLFSKETGALVQPKKKDFLFVIATKQTHYSAGDAGSIGLDAARKTVRWSVAENNHAVDFARDSIMGSVFFKLMRKVVWTRGSGGTIVGNDEYNKDSRESGGAANYEKESFGPRTQMPKKRTVPAVKR